MENSRLFRTAALLLIVASASYLVTQVWQLFAFLFDLLLVVFLAWIIASNIQRLVQWLHIRTGVRFGLAVAVAYVAVLSPVVAFFTLFIPIAVGQAVQLSASLPELAEDAPRLLERAQSIATDLGFDVDLSGIYEAEFVSQAGRLVGEWLLTNSFSIAQTTVGALFQMFIIATLSVYIVLEGERLSNVFLRVVPRQMHDEVRFVYATMDRIFEQWLRGILIIGGIFALTTFTVMSVAGLPYAVVFSLAAGLLVIIPFIGDFIAIGLPVTAALLDGSILKAAAVGGVLVGIDVLVLNLFVSPRVLGQAVRGYPRCSSSSVSCWARNWPDLGGLCSASR